MMIIIITMLMITTKIMILIMIMIIMIVIMIMIIIIIHAYIYIYIYIYIHTHMSAFKGSSRGVSPLLTLGACSRGSGQRNLREVTSYQVLPSAEKSFRHMPCYSRPVSGRHRQCRCMIQERLA